MRWGTLLICAGFVLATTPALVLADDDQATTKADFFGARVSPQELDRQRGGEMYVNSVDEQAELSRNNATNNVTGNNFITDNAFGGAAGLPVAVQNSGNNVIIQNSFIVNLQMQ